MASDVKTQHPGSKPLESPAQETFVQEYFLSKNQTTAAEKAGYSKKTAASQGSRLLKNVKIAQRLEFLLEEQKERVQVDADYVIRTIVDTIERCRQARPVFDKDGDPVMVETPAGDVAPAYAFDSKGVLRGAELLGKYLKLFTERHEHSGPDGKPIEVKDASLLSDAEIDNQLQKYLKKMGIKTKKGT
jgi:phage terminase small subunit